MANMFLLILWHLEKNCQCLIAQKAAFNVAFISVMASSKSYFSTWNSKVDLDIDII